MIVGFAIAAAARGSKARNPSQLRRAILDVRLVTSNEYQNLPEGKGYWCLKSSRGIFGPDVSSGELTASPDHGDISQ